MSNRVLFIIRGGMGDAVLLLSVMQAFRKAWDARIEVLYLSTATGDFCDFADGRTVIDDYHTWLIFAYQRVMLEGGSLDLPEEFTDLAGRFNAVIAYDVANHYERRRLDRLKNIAFLTHRHCMRWADRHLTEIWADDLVDQGFNVGKLDPPEILMDAPDHRLPTVAIAPGSADIRKCWAKAGWMGLRDQLLASGRTVRWILGPAEDTREFDWARHTGDEVCSGDSLEERVRSVLPCSQYIGVDSGFSHVIAACGHPTTVVYSEVASANLHPEHWRPLSTSCRIVRPPSVSPSVESVYSVLERNP
jgi:hypothetical protein